MRRYLGLLLFILATPIYGQGVAEFQASLRAFACESESGKEISLAIANVRGSDQISFVGLPVSDQAPLQAQLTETGWQVQGADFQGFLSLTDGDWHLFFSSEFGQVTASCSDVSETAAAVATWALEVTSYGEKNGTDRSGTRIYSTRLSAGETEALRIAISRCWQNGLGSRDPLRTRIVVGLSLFENTMPINGSIRLVSYPFGTQEDAHAAFAVARRSIIECGRQGLPLPRTKYEYWRNMVLVFGPDGIWLD